ncbi:MAG TPA: hypothetical protein VHO46_09640 [Bacteroidales bacterium]|nr:hypothetical protein [Bacteroidales bacterium]
MIASPETVEKYYVAVKPQTNEIHSVHREGCPFMPDDNKRIYLGRFQSCDEASNEGRKHFHNSHGCPFCSKESYEPIPDTSFHEITIPASESILQFLN